MLFFLTSLAALAALPSQVRIVFARGSVLAICTVIYAQSSASFYFQIFNLAV